MKTTEMQLTQVDEYQNVILFLKNVGLIKKSEMVQEVIDFPVNDMSELISTDMVVNM